MLRLPIMLALVGFACATSDRRPADPPAEASTPAAEAVADSLADAADALDEGAPPDSTTMRAFSALMERAAAERWHMRPYGELVQAVGEAFLGTPYRDGLLDQGDTETLVASLAAFDCVLFVENTLALAQGIAAEDYSFDGYLRRLEALRYRGGQMDGYCSRLHYFTDWIFDNDRRALVRDITREAGGEPFDKRLDFMSTHRSAYRRLVDDATFQCIVEMEGAVQERPLFYIPEARIADAYPELEAGDVIATATSIGGLDVTHTGFVYRYPDGRTGFLHASATGEVKISPDLQGYVEEHRNQVGVIVARPVDPRG